MTSSVELSHQPIRLHTQAEVLERIGQSRHQKIKVAIADIDGILRGKYISREKFVNALQSGFGFCDVVFGWDSADVCYDNVDYTGWHTGYPDAQVRLDPKTYREIPWEDDLPFMLGHLVDKNEEPLPICPRQLLQRIISQAKEMGYSAKFGIEFEWFNFQENAQSLADKGYHSPRPITPGMFGYSLLRSSQQKEYFNALMDELRLYGIPLEGLHTETGPGVYEAAITVSDPLEAADRATLFKAATKEIAARFGILPSFMAKWNQDLPGCSGHLHQSLTTLSPQSKQRGAFFDASDIYKMSPVFKQYLAGQLVCLPVILPMFAPTVNSYKRLVEGMWAPTRVTWSVDNRTASLRVIPGSEKSTRLETRVPGSDINPYLAVSAALASGLYGIKNALKVTDVPVKGNAYKQEDAIKLPATLWEATSAFEQSDIVTDLFGEYFQRHFAATRHWESRQFFSAVTSWEMKRYFEII